MVQGYLRGGSFFGELSLIGLGLGDQGDIRERTVVAVSACSLTFITKQDVDRLRQEHPPLEEKMIALGARRLQHDEVMNQALAKRGNAVESSTENDASLTESALQQKDRQQASQARRDSLKSDKGKKLSSGRRRGTMAVGRGRQGSLAVHSLSGHSLHRHASMILGKDGESTGSGNLKDRVARAEAALSIERAHSASGRPHNMTSSEDGDADSVDSITSPDGHGLAGGRLERVVSGTVSSWAPPGPVMPSSFRGQRPTDYHHAGAGHSQEVQEGMMDSATSMANSLPRMARSYDERQQRRQRQPTTRRRSIHGGPEMAGLDQQLADWLLPTAQADRAAAARRPSSAASSAAEDAIAAAAAAPPFFELLMAVASLTEEMQSQRQELAVLASPSSGPQTPREAFEVNTETVRKRAVLLLDSAGGRPSVAMEALGWAVENRT